MHKKYVAVAAIFGGLAVALGAFRAHGLQNMTSDEKIIHGFQTGVQYQLMHSLALLLVGSIANQLPAKWLLASANCFIAGMIFFSGSLYLLSFLKLNESPAVKIVGPITPVGGIFLILGWLLLLLAVVKKKRS